MRKAVLVLTVGLAIVAFSFVLTGSRAKKLPLAKIPVRRVLPKGRPLVWLDERFLLTGVDNKIVKLDTTDSRIVEVVAEPYYPGVGYECFSRDGGRFAVTAPEENNQGISYMNMVYRSIQDWDQPALFDELKTCEAWNTNPHDCTAVDYEEATGEEQSARRLLKAADGRTRVFTRRAQTEGQFEWAVTIEKDGPAAQVTLGQPRSFFSQDMRSSFDESSGQYFWYLATRDFDLNNPHWPLKGWWVTPEGRVTETVILPSGPWIKKFSMLYTLRFFSCGPQCYSYMEMWAGNGQLYIAVWGRAIDPSVRGVYRLDAQGQAWEKIISGTVDNGLILSPRGCQIAFATGDRLQVMTVCENPHG